MNEPEQATAAELHAMRRALELATTPGVPRGPNPRVGCVLLDERGAPVGQGHHRGAGTAHAEVAALAEAGSAARGATAVVTLEPCRHHGRTGPCVEALIAAGVRRVVFGQSDPNPAAAGGARHLARHGVQVLGGVLADEATAVNEAWTFAVRNGRPMVTWKVAATLDGRVAALARSVLTTPIVRQVVGGAPHWRELFVAAPIVTVLKQREPQCLQYADVRPTARGAPTERHTDIGRDIGHLSTVLLFAGRSVGHTDGVTTCNHVRLDLARTGSEP